MATDATGHGYWLVARDGGIFAFGDARFHGSTGRIHLNARRRPGSDSPGQGYWLVAAMAASSRTAMPSTTARAAILSIGR